MRWWLPALIAGLALAGPPAANARAAQTAATTPSTTSISTSQFVNRFDAEPYVGNGYFSQRVPAAGMGLLTGLGKIGWPLGTPRFTQALAAGLYARTNASVAYYPTETKQVIALIPTWSTLTFATPRGDTYSPRTVRASQISRYRQTENLQAGTVTTTGTWRSPRGQRARFTYQLFTDLSRKHVGVVSLTLTPQWNGRTTVTGLLDGRGASHLLPAGAGVNRRTHTSFVNSLAIGTRFRVAESSTLRFAPTLVRDGAIARKRSQTAGEQITFIAHRGRTYTFTKYVAVVTSRDSKRPSTDAYAASLQAARRGKRALQSENGRAWAGIWNSRVLVSGDAPLQRAINANTYDLYASIRSDSPDAIGPSGLSSNGYAGMIFWDSDIWMYPAILATHPEIARAAVDYRFNTLKAAEHDAAANGYQGAFFPWTAGDDGYTGNDCYGTTTAANDKITSDPNFSCSEELHLQADIAMSQWEYYQATGDRTWLQQHGWPVLQALAQFWVSKAVADPKGGYDLNTIQPPDEYHTGVNNSAYTNAAAATALNDAIKAANVLGQTPPATWATVAKGVTQTMPFNSSLNIYNEYAGYNGEQIKQADTVMLTYPLNFPVPSGVGLNDLNYYAPRTDLQGPAMTDAIHSIDASTLNAAGCSAYTYMLRSYEPFLRAPYDQFAETRTGPNTGFNFLTGVGGFLQVFEYGFSGLRFAPAAIQLDPSLPPQLPGVTLKNLHWQGRVFTVAVGPQSTRVSLTSGSALPVQTPGGQKSVAPGQSVTIPTRRPDQQPTTDLARCQQITASSNVPGNEPVAAVDGSTATPWIPTGPKATLTVQLAKATSISAVTVTRGSTAPYGYSVETSTDGSTWHAAGTAPSSSTGTDTVTFSPTQAQYVRLDFPGGTGAGTPDISEVSVR
ncbi:MAG TPA: discoidin domain-containing protein [Solirubrobacteraceae bacterium]|nr:discoidin domain-containing protein [Solirubrobacteraceae bacterium]